jgi:hypothetical protein
MRRRNPDFPSLLFTLFLSVALPLAMILSLGQRLGSVFQVYGVLASLSWIALYFFKIDWLKFKSVSMLTAIINVAVMLVSGTFAAQLAAQKAAFVIVPLTLSSVTPLVEVNFVTITLAFLVGWTEEMLYGGLLYGMLQRTGIWGKLAVAAVFAFMHVKAYIPNASPFDLTFLQDPRAYLLLAPFITRFVQCYLIDFEDGIAGVALGHGIGDALLMIRAG